jgi:phospholipid transport system substrate-binding protein
VPAFKIFSVIIALVALTFVTATPVMAQKSDAPTTFVQQLGDQALSSLTAPDLAVAERETRVRRLLRNNFDIDTIARFSLGTYWRTASAAEKQEFMGLFEDMIVKTYAQRFAEYSGQSFSVTDSMPAGSKDMIVQSKIVQKDGPPVHVDWRLRPGNGGMRVIDVIVEDISMSVTQRSDFASVIQQGGGTVTALNASLRERIRTAKK